MENRKKNYEPEIQIRVNPIIISNVFEALSFNLDNPDRIRAREIWENAEQGAGIVIAVLDSGIQTDHPDLVGNIIGGYNFTKDDHSNPEIYSDYLGHGTHVSGVIAAADNNKGVVGIAPKCKLLILKIINRQGEGSFKALTNAINYAIDWRGPKGEKVRIINMSVGGKDTNDELYRAIKYAHSKGIILVAAAGNEGDGDPITTEVSYPGFYKEVIQVGSLSETKIPSKFSNTNVNLDFVGPGENILSTHLNGDYVKLTGTSMAAPFVSGSAALILKILVILKCEWHLFTYMTICYYIRYP